MKRIKLHSQKYRLHQAQLGAYRTYCSASPASKPTSTWWPSSQHPAALLPLVSYFAFHLEHERRDGSCSVAGEYGLRLQ